MKPSLMNKNVANRQILIASAGKVAAFGARWVIVLSAGDLREARVTRWREGRFLKSASERHWVTAPLLVPSHEQTGNMADYGGCADLGALLSFHHAVTPCGWCRSAARPQRGPTPGGVRGRAVIGDRPRNLSSTPGGVAKPTGLVSGRPRRLLSLVPSGARWVIVLSA
jgi:hypothetical protein